MKLEAQKRSSGKPQAIRAEGRIPAVIYNKKLNVPVSVEGRAFDKVFRSQGTSHVIDLDVDGENHEVLVKAVQMDKRRRVPLHIDFYEVTAGQQVDVNVHLDYIGTPAGAKEGGQVDVQRREVHIKVLPRLIPEKIEVDVSGLAIGDSLHVSDILDKFPAEAEVLEDPERTLIAVLAPRLVEETEETEAAEVLEPELVSDEGEDEEAADEE